MWNDEDEFDDEAYEKEQERVENLPIVKKANELFELVNALTETFHIKDEQEEITEEDEVEHFFEEDGYDPEEVTELTEEDLDQLADQYKNVMMEDVITINTKLRGAEAGDLYSIRMENAVIIKTHAVSLLTAVTGLQMLGLSRNKYLQLLVDEIEEFRVLFVAWIGTFDKTNDIPDEWGLFYDPNINYQQFEDDDNDDE